MKKSSIAYAIFIAALFVVFAVLLALLQGCVTIDKETTVIVLLLESELNLNVGAELAGEGDDDNE